MQQPQEYAPYVAFSAPSQQQQQQATLRRGAIGDRGAARRSRPRSLAADEGQLAPTVAAILAKVTDWCAKERVSFEQLPEAIAQTMALVRAVPDLTGFQRRAIALQVGEHVVAALAAKFLGDMDPVVREITEDAAMALLGSLIDTGFRIAKQEFTIASAKADAAKCCFAFGARQASRPRK